MNNNHHKLVSAGDNTNNQHYRQYYIKGNKRSNFDVGASASNPTDVTSSH